MRVPTVLGTGQRRWRGNTSAASKDLLIMVYGKLLPPAFSNPPISTSFVTILREPLDRVWSFYWYLRRWYVPYQQIPLDVIILHPNVALDQAKNKTRHVPCAFCRDQLFNGMTSYFSLSFASPGDQRHVAEAIKYLAGLSLIGDTTGLNAFVARLRKLWSPLVGSAQLCPIPKINTNPHPHLSDAPAKMRAALATANALDMQLYDSALRLPNFARD